MDFGVGYFRRMMASDPDRWPGPLARMMNRMMDRMMNRMMNRKQVLEAMHVRRALHWLPSGPRGPVERALECWGRAINEFTGG